MKAHFFAAALAATALGLAPAIAQDYPSKPIEVVIPFAPGGVSDLLIRAVGPKISDEFKQPVVVLNKPGANGNTHTATAMQAPADGYTLIQTPLSTLSTNPFIYGDKLPYKVNDMVLVAPLATLPLFLVAHPSVPAKNIREFLALAKANPGSTYGSAGIGGSNHLAGEMLRHAAGVEITHVPFNGSAPALNAVLGGHVQWMFDSGRVVQHVKAGSSSSSPSPPRSACPTIRTCRRWPSSIPASRRAAGTASRRPRARRSPWSRSSTPRSAARSSSRTCKKTLANASLIPVHATPEEYCGLRGGGVEEVVRGDPQVERQGGVRSMEPVRSRARFGTEVRGLDLAKPLSRDAGRRNPRAQWLEDPVLLFRGQKLGARGPDPFQRATSGRVERHDNYQAELRYP